MGNRKKNSSSEAHLKSSKINRREVWFLFKYTSSVVDPDPGSGSVFNRAIGSGSVI